MRLLSLITLAVALWTATAVAAPIGYKPKSRPAGTDEPEPFLERPGDVPLSQVVLEVGWAQPYGDLGDDFITTPLGFGAGDGMEIGFRWRLHLSRVFSLAPAFHFSNLGSFQATVDPEGDVTVNSSIYSYTVEALLRTGGGETGVHPFLAVGGGLYRNRVEGLTKALVAAFDQSVNTVGWEARAGIAVGQLEFSAVYNVNRFTSPRFFDAPLEHDYNWDTLVLRVGWVVPLGIPLTPDE